MHKKKPFFRIGLLLVLVALAIMLLVLLLAMWSEEIAADTIDWRYKGRCDTADYAEGVAVMGDYAYVADRENGLVIIDITDRTDPQEVGHLDTADWARGVVVVGDYAYVADYHEGLVIVDISDKTDPQEAGHYNTSGSAWGVAVADDYAYVADGNNGLVIVDITDKTDPQETGHYDTSYARGVAVVGDYAYVANGGGGLVIVEKFRVQIDCRFKGGYDTAGHARGAAVKDHYIYIADSDYYTHAYHIDRETYVNLFEPGDGLVIIDVSDPMEPQYIGGYNTAGNVRNVVVNGDYAYVADSDYYTEEYNPYEGFYYDEWHSGDGLVIIDVSDPTEPQYMGGYDTAGDAQGVVVNGDYAYVADEKNGLVVVDIADKTNPQEAGHYNTAGYAYDVAVMDDYAYVADDDNGLVIVDITNKTDPQEGGHYDTGRAEGVTVAGDYAYVADGSNGLVIINITNKTNPQEVGGYDTASYAGSVAVSGGYAYVANGDTGLVVMELTPVAHIDSITPNPALDTNVVSFRGHGTTGNDGSIVRYVWHSSLDGDIHNSTTPNFHTADLTPGEHIIDFSVLDNHGVWSDKNSDVLVVTERAHIDFISPSLALDAEMVQFRGHGTDSTTIMRYVWHSSLDGEIHNSTDSDFDRDTLSLGEHEIYFKVMDNTGIWSDEVTQTMHVLDPTADDDSDGLSNQQELKTFLSNPLSSNLLPKIEADISCNPTNPKMIDEISIEVSILAPDVAEIYYLHYKTLISDWKKVRAEDVEESGFMNLNQWLSFDKKAEESLTWGKIINFTFTFPPYEFTTGEEIQYYITDSNGFNYNDMEQKGNDDPGNVNNIKTMSIESETTLIYSITDEALFSLAASILLALLLLKYRFYKRFEKVKYAKEIGKVSQENFIINMFQLFTKAKIKELLRFRKGGKFVTFIYFVGITGLLLIAGELFLNPKEISVLSVIALLFFLGISITTPFLFTFFTRWKERAPLIGRFRFIVGSISLVVIFLFFLAPRYYNEVLFEGTGFETNILAESEENTMYTYLAIFFLLFGVPTILYGNIMGTSWNFLVRTLSKEVRTGFSFLSWEKEGISKRAISFFQLIAIAFMPLFAINALIGLVAGNYGKGGYIGVATAAAIGKIGYEDFTEIASRLVAVFILLNVVLVGAAMVFRVVQLQFLNSSRFSGKWGVVYKRHGDIAKSKEDQLTLILMVFGIFFGYTILLLLLSIYSHFGYLMPIIPFVSVHVMETLMVGLSATTNFFFLLFWTVSLSRTRRVLKIERTPDGQGLIIPKTRRERKAEESFIQDFQMAVR